MVRLLESSFIRSSSTPDIGSLASDFLKVYPIPKTEGQCAASAKAFSEFLTKQGIKSNIIDARNYKGSLTTVGGSNHVLVAIGDKYVDFTATQFNPSAKSIEVDDVANLKNDWDVVNTYNDYSDFLTNFSPTNR